MKITFTIPKWLSWLIPKRIRDDLDRRARLTGKARRTKTWEF